MKALLVAVVVAVAVIALAGVTANTAQAAPAQQVQGYHVVRPGETLFCIGRGYRVNPWVIAQVNHLMNPNLLRIGQRLAIPAGPYWFAPGPTCPVQCGPGPAPVPQPAPSCAAYHVVQPGQTLYAISLLFGVPVQQIALANGLANPNYIRAYQTLCIPPAAMAPHYDGPGHHH
jgi:LysM repeat protein